MSSVRNSGVGRDGCREQAVRGRWHCGPAVWAVLLSVAFLGLQFGALWGGMQVRNASALVVTVVAIGSMALYVLIVVGLVFSIARLNLPAAAQLALAAVFGVALWVARAGRWPLGGDLLLVLGAAFLGALVSRLIREPNLLVPVALVVAMVDVWGVYFGVVRQISEHAPETAAALSASVPMAAGPMLGMIGVGDFAFMAMFFAAVVRLGLRGRATAWASAGALLAASGVLVCASLWPALAPMAAQLPGLPFLAVAVLLVNLRGFHLSREEARAIVVVVLVLGAVLAAVALAWRPGAEPGG